MFYKCTELLEFVSAVTHAAVFSFQFQGRNDYLYFKKKKKKSPLGNEVSSPTNSFNIILLADQ